MISASAGGQEEHPWLVKSSITAFGARAPVCAGRLRHRRAKGEGGDDTLYISYSQDMAREYIDACAGFAKALMDVDAEVGEFMFDDEIPGTRETDKIQAFRIKFASGYEIQALSSAPRSLRGKQGRVRIDEAAFVNNLDELLKAAMALTIAVLTFLYCAIVIAITHFAADRMRASPATAVWLNRIAGSMLVGFGVKLAAGR